MAPSVVVLIPQLRIWMEVSAVDVEEVLAEEPDVPPAGCRGQLWCQMVAMVLVPAALVAVM